jgi:3-deoxy-D-manno-octulosonate 8-phosphate phosphatase (KDO 8-P phosphatase)
VLDVDGVLSDGKIYLGNQGEELKAFNAKDGYGVKAMQACGVDVAVITGRRSTIVQKWRLTMLTLLSNNKLILSLP